MSSIVLTLVVIAAAVALAIAMAYLPLRLIVSHIARNVVEFIQRQRERRGIARETPERRKVSEVPPQ